MSPFYLSSTLCSSGFRGFCISSIYSFLDSFTGCDFFENIYLQGLMPSSYEGKNWLEDPKIPMLMQRSPHVLVCSILENASFLKICILCSPFYNIHP